MGLLMGRIKAPIAEKVSAKLAGRNAKPGMHAVGGTPGLYLLVSGAGRSWVLRYMLNGKRRDMGLGSYQDLTLAEAREKAREQRLLIRDGLDPIEAKRHRRGELLAAQAKRITFADAVDAYLNAKGDEWKNPKHRQQWRNTLSTYALPTLGPLDVAQIDTTLVVRVLEEIWKDKTETATRLRGRIENVLDWATVRGYRTGDNPARWRGHLDQLLAKPSKIASVQHHAALPWQEIGAFMRSLSAVDGNGARALEFAILTAARSGEVRGATWAEIDLDGAVWTIPAERMKARKEHRIPLSRGALAVLRMVKPRRATPETLVFPGAKEGRPLSDMSLTAVLKRMGRSDLTAHGFRSTFRDWAGESTAYAREIIEHALAHQLKDKAEAAYARGTLFEKRIRLMADWAAYCATVPSDKAKVLPMNPAA